MRQFLPTRRLCINMSGKCSSLRLRWGFDGDFLRGRRSLIFELDTARFRQIGNESVFESSASPLTHQLSRWPDCQNLAGVHQGNAVAALGLIHEMGRDEYRDAIVARQMD